MRHEPVLGQRARRARPRHRAGDARRAGGDIVAAARAGAAPAESRGRLAAARARVARGGGAGHRQRDRGGDRAARPAADPHSGDHAYRRGARGQAQARRPRREAASPPLESQSRSRPCRWPPPRRRRPRRRSNGASAAPRGSPPGCRAPAAGPARDRGKAARACRPTSAPPRSPNGAGSRRCRAPSASSRWRRSRPSSWRSIRRWRHVTRRGSRRDRPPPPTATPVWPTLPAAAAPRAGALTPISAPNAARDGRARWRPQADALTPDQRAERRQTITRLAAATPSAGDSAVGRAEAAAGAAAARPKDRRARRR